MANIQFELLKDKFMTKKELEQQKLELQKKLSELTIQIKNEEQREIELKTPSLQEEFKRCVSEFSEKFETLAAERTRLSKQKQDLIEETNGKIRQIEQKMENLSLEYSIPFQKDDLGDCYSFVPTGLSKEWEGLDGEWAGQLLFEHSLLGFKSGFNFKHYENRYDGWYHSSC